MLDTNLWGTIVTCRAALKHFGNDGGSIINIGSMSSERFSGGAVAYTASKAGITGVTGVLAVELASRGHPRQSNQLRCGGHRRRTGNRGYE